MADIIARRQRPGCPPVQRHRAAPFPVTMLSLPPSRPWRPRALMGEIKQRAFQLIGIAQRAPQIVRGCDFKIDGLADRPCRSRSSSDTTS